MAKTELERIAQLEVVANENKKDIVKLKEETSAFYRLAVNQDMLTSTLNTLVKDNKEQMKDFSTTLSSVNTNLTNLNNKSDDMREDLNKFENELKDVKSNHEKIENKGKFDLNNFLFQEAPKYIGLAIIGFLLAYFGLK